MNEMVNAAARPTASACWRVMWASRTSYGGRPRTKTSYRVRRTGDRRRLPRQCRQAGVRILFLGSVAMSALLVAGPAPQRVTAFGDYQFGMTRAQVGHVP